ncbi:MAG: hypothetical protein WCK13_02720 [Ignavibacteriota bacterium]|nr:hypothetical protein [Ignavibacteriota bacterium]
MNNEDVYKYYGWNPSDGDYTDPVYEEVRVHNKFSIFVRNFYNKFLRVITLKFF